MADVTNLDDERAKRRRQKKDDRFSLSELFFQIILKMNRDQYAAQAWPPFPHKFHVLRDIYGHKNVLEELPNRTVLPRTPDMVTDAIARYCYEHLAHTPEASISHKSADACKKLWMSLTDNMKEEPLALAELSEPRLAFHRLSFDAEVEYGDDFQPVVPEIPPYFGEFIGRCSAGEAICAFIGSLFYPEADRSQYIYLFGDGLDGKGAFLRFLYLLLGSSAEALQPRGRDDRFWNMKIYGKRLILFNDCEDAKFFSSPEFKCITGNDPIYFEGKGEKGFSAIPTCKTIAASNYKPNISTQRSDLRRLIYSEVSPVTKVVPNYETRLLSEAREIIRYCKAIYERAVGPEHGSIPCREATDIGSEAEEFYLNIFHQNFELRDPDHFIDGVAVFSVLEKHGIRSGPEVSRLKGVWHRHFGVVVCKVSTVRYYGMGLIARDATH